MTDLKVYQIDINVNREKYDEAYKTLVDSYGDKFNGSNPRQVPTMYYNDLDGCNSVISKFCYNYPKNCYNLMNEYIAQTTDYNMIKNPDSVTGQICDESEKQSNSKITDEFQKTDLYNSCKGKYITNVCSNPLKRYLNSFINKERFSGNCIDICDTDAYKDNVDIQLACTTGAINHCLDGDNNIYHSNCKYDTYFDSDATKDIIIKKLQNVKSNTINEYINEKKSDIYTFKNKYCDTILVNKPAYCNNIPQTTSQSVDVVSSTQIEEPQQQTTNETQTKKDDTSYILYIIIFIIIVCMGIFIRLKIKTPRQPVNTYNTK
jgi:hypothetical protein